MKKTQPGYTNLSAHLGLLAVSIIYGVNYFTLKWTYADGVHSWAILSMRSIIGVTAFTLFQYFFIKEKVTDKKDLLRLAVCALFGVSINQLFFLWGLSKTSGLNAGVLMITTPVFVFLIAFIFRQEKFYWRKIGGLTLAFIGAFLLIQESAGKNFSLGNDSLVGDLMIMVNAASYALYLVLVRPLILKYNTFTIICYVFLFGSLINIPLGFPYLLETDFSALSWQGWTGLIWALAGATLLAYFGNAWSMKRLPSSAVGMYIFVQPVFVTLISAAFIVGSVGLEKLGFILVILAGVGWVVFKK